MRMRRHLLWTLRIPIPTLPRPLGRLLFATKEDLFVATLRFLPLIVSRSLSLIAAAVALTGVVLADETNRPEPPRAIMRLPRWIESIGEPATKLKAEPQTMAAPTLKALGSSNDQGSSINQGGTARPAFPQANGPMATAQANRVPAMRRFPPCQQLR